jgi:integrase
MASVYKPAGSKRYAISYRDETGRMRKKTGTADKAVTERIAREIENRVALRKEGIIDPREESYAIHAGRSLLEHIEDWSATLRSKGNTEQHVGLHTSRAMRVVALVMGAQLAEIGAAKPATQENVRAAEASLRRWAAKARIGHLVAEDVQKALARLIAAGRSHSTANHHRGAIVSFARWLFEAHRIREMPLRGVAGYNPKEDPRHERRTISLEEFHRLIAATEKGPPFRKMAGLQRALCYRLAAASGLRHEELGSIRSGSFNWSASPATVTVRAAYTKNGQDATLALPEDVAADVKAYVAGIPADSPVFPLPPDEGARMLRVDLEAAEIPYRDAASRVFDFHSLRCMLATLADAAGVSPRVIQRLMRHASLELTGRYTRPRVADLDAAVEALPPLKAPGNAGATAGATGIEKHHRKPRKSKYL